MEISRINIPKEVLAKVLYGWCKLHTNLFVQSPKIFLNYQNYSVLVNIVVLLIVPIGRQIMVRGARLREARAHKKLAKLLKN